MEDLHLPSEFLQGNLYKKTSLLVVLLVLGTLGLEDWQRDLCRLQGVPSSAPPGLSSQGLLPTTLCRYAPHFIHDPLPDCMLATHASSSYHGSDSAPVLSCLPSTGVGGCLGVMKLCTTSLCLPSWDSSKLGLMLGRMRETVNLNSELELHVMLREANNARSNPS